MLSPLQPKKVPPMLNFFYILFCLVKCSFSALQCVRETMVPRMYIINVAVSLKRVRNTYFWGQKVTQCFFKSYGQQEFDQSQDNSPNSSHSQKDLSPGGSGPSFWNIHKLFGIGLLVVVLSNVLPTVMIADSWIIFYINTIKHGRLQHHSWSRI